MIPWRASQRALITWHHSRVHALARGFRW